ncbi:MAG: uroporphyrinogen decarboxylase family protein, partial [Victivallales bacterium]
MGSKERVIAAIRHKNSDRIPKGELEIDNSLRAKLLGQELSGDDFRDEVKIRKLLDMDIAPLAYANRPENKIIETQPDGRKITEDIWGSRYVQGGHSTEQIAWPIKDIEDVYRYEFPALDSFRNHTISQWKQDTDFFVFAQLDGGFNGVYPLFGLTEFLMYSATNPEDIKFFINKTIDYWLELAKIILKAEPDGILIGDDMAYNTATMMSPESLRELVFPAMKREVRTLKKMSGGLPVFLHSDGNLNAVLDDIVDIGFDGLQSLQPSAAMDIGKIKAEYGDRLCLMGNVDLNYLLP